MPTRAEDDREHARLHEHEAGHEAGHEADVDVETSLDELVERIHRKLDDLTSDVVLLQGIAEDARDELARLKGRLNGRGRVA